VEQNILEFVLGGYNQQGEPQIAQIGWRARNQLFLPTLESSHYYITGILDIGNYFTNKGKDYLPNMNTMALQKLATLLITETSTTERSVNDKIQMAVIEKREKLQFIAIDEIEKLKSDVSKAIDKEELCATLIN
jgi:hypothetical protein